MDGDDGDDGADEDIAGPFEERRVQRSRVQSLASHLVIGAGSRSAPNPDIPC